MYRLLPHTADIRLLVKGETPEMLFRSALEGMVYIQIGKECSGWDDAVAREDSLSIQSTDQTSLLIDFLSEVLTYSHVYKVVYCTVRFDRLTTGTLVATLFGRTVEEFEEDIKAVTYHEADIYLDEDRMLTTRIIFDI